MQNKQKSNSARCYVIVKQFEKHVPSSAGQPKTYIPHLLMQIRVKEHQITLKT